MNNLFSRRSCRVNLGVDDGMILTLTPTPSAMYGSTNFTRLSHLYRYIGIIEKFDKKNLL
jgi:hypothetical protein